MRILFLYLFPLYGNGSGTFLRELSLELTSMGHDVAILAPDKRKLKGIKHYVVTPPQMGVFVGHPELPTAKKFGEMNGKELGDIYVSYFKATLDAVVDFKPDLIHVFHLPFLPETARLMKVLFGIKYLITTHGSDLSFLAKDRRYIPLLQEANKNARFITANSGFTKQWYVRVFGGEIKRKTSVIVGGVHPDRYSRDANQIKKVNERFNLRDNHVVLYTGRLTEHKGVKYLVRAAKSINGIVLIVGDGPERQNLEADIKKLGLPNVVMAGYVKPDDPMLHALYERADVFVSPSVWDEPMGFTILEAMTAHTPVVATRKGGVTDIIQEGKNGFLINARSSRQIADAVNLLLIDDGLRERIGNAAYETIQNKFSWEKIAESFEKLYLQTAKKEKEDLQLPLDDFFKKLFMLE